MMEIKRFVSNQIGENCYLIWDETKEAAIIDCGAIDPVKQQRISQFVADNGLTLKLVLQTHTHFDHIFGLPFLYRDYGLRPMFHIAEQPIYDAAPQMSSEWFGVDIPSPLPAPQAYLADNSEVVFGNTTLKVLHTPGHTPGGVSFYEPNSGVVFTGDTLFAGGIGRTDLPLGNYADEINSIRQRLFTLPPSTVVYPGHGPSSTIGDESVSNPYI